LVVLGKRIGTIPGRTLAKILELRCPDARFLLLRRNFDSNTNRLWSEIRRARDTADQIDRIFGRHANTPYPLRVGPLIVDPENYDARINGKFLVLTPTEIHIMYVFADRLGELITADELFDLVWSNDAAGKNSSSGKRRRIAVYVNRLRAKCRAETDAITFRTLRHVGYQLLVSRCDGTAAHNV
jgi:DNA-binding response OmpR family regulator